MTLQVVILAAGQGKRMRSDLPKVLHPLGGRPMLAQVVETARLLSPAKLAIVVGHGADTVIECMADPQVAWVHQERQLGTGHAVQQALPHVDAQGTVLILYGDMPLIASGTLRSLVDAAARHHLAILTQEVVDPKGYGRIVRNGAGRVSRIVEEKDATATQKAIEICNSGVIFAEKDLLFSLLGQLTTANAQKEYYLTDCFALARQQNIPSDVWVTDAYEAFDGVNDRRQLADLEQRILRRIRERWMLAGVSFQLADSCYIEEGVIIAEDATIGPHVSLLGRTRIGKSCEIGSHVYLKDVIIPDGTKVPAGTIQSPNPAS